MSRYIVVRLLQSAFTLFAVALVTFLLMHAVPGGPFDVQAGDRGVSQEFIESQESYYGLNDSIPVQFVRYVGNLLQGDLGVSYQYRGQTVSDLLLDKLRPSFILALMSFSILIGVGIPVGVFAAAKRNSGWDYGVLAVTSVAGAIPSFVLAFILLLVFAVWLDAFDVRLGKGFGDSLASLPNGILPAVALGANAAALLARITRSAMLDVLKADYVRTAYAKGLSARAVYVRHALRSALIPVVTVLGPLFTFLITGSIVIESIFGLPGIGTEFVNAITRRDYGMIMGTTLFFAAVIIAVNFVVDLIYPLLDPRVRLS
jgi:oligopeptide transport system permease protein